MSAIVLFKAREQVHKRHLLDCSLPNGDLGGVSHRRTVPWTIPGISI
ncbi:hypothetical protein [Rhodococcus sp. O3]